MTGKVYTGKNIDFRSLFEMLPGLYLVICNDADYTILAANDAYLNAVGKKREETIGFPLFEVFTSNPDDPDENANNIIDKSIKRVLKSKTTDQMPLVKYDVEISSSRGGALEVRYWTAYNSPVLNKANEVMYIVHRAEDVTASILADKKAADLMKIAMSELDEKSQFIKSNQERVNQILDVLMNYTLLDFSQRIGLSENDDELDAIVVGLNTLSEELEIHIKQLEETSKQLSSVNKELESFSYSVSHDLRAPLRAIDGYARILEEDHGNVLDSDGKRLLGVIQYNARKMGTLIDDLLAFSRLGKKELQRSNIDMKELIEAALVDVNKSIKNNALIKMGTLHPLKADYSLMNQVMVNLISNAVKYSSKNENSVVEIGSSVMDGNIVYTITDNGVGFNMNYAHKLFGVFQRLHTMDEFEGTGVGLAIVLRVINKHEGKIWADSTLGKGASFSFSIPDN